jgi:hypothetical protein
VENKQKIYSSNRHQNSDQNNKTTRLLLQDNPTVCHCDLHATKEVKEEEEASFYSNAAATRVVIKAAILFSPSFLPFFLCCEIG